MEKNYSVRNAYKAEPTYFKEIFCGDERQIITSKLPEKFWDWETASTIATLLNMGADKTGCHWEINAN